MPEIYLDFDGVICDSAFEAFRVGLVAHGASSSAYYNGLDYLYPKFLEKRAHVGPAWNYFYVFRELLENNWSPWLASDEAVMFQRVFFEERAKACQQMEQWLRLHKFYPVVLDALKKSKKALNILTNKNSEPVFQLLEISGIEVADVFSMPELPEFRDKTDFLFKLGKNVKFIDDHPSIVRGVMVGAPNVDVKQAKWGYGVEWVLGKTIDEQHFEEWLNDRF